VKNRFKNIVLILVSALLLVFGNSVNIFHFCCDICRDHAKEVITSGDCSFYHENNDDFETTSLENHSIYCKGNCFADAAFQEDCGHESSYQECLSITLDNFKPDFNIKPIYTLLSTLVFVSFPKPAEPDFINTHKFYYAEAFPLSGRQILDKNCTLRR
jgi:hypothetical protein